MNRNRWMSLLLHLAVWGMLSGCAQNLTAPEKAAVRFYKEVWVEGNVEQAQRMLDRPDKVKEIGWRVQEVQNEERKNPPILLVQSPTDRQMGTHTILIHRPSDKRDYKVRLQLRNGEWKVVKFEQNFDPRAGGYVSQDAYQRLGQEYPEIQWKRVDSP
ncbi:hypothetical protein [Salinithrix halophila]|uniref:DUF4878 domain-containing protein n=1 Tax=Salinithrix halophila TaxID=1485204 RepID=A0ABV8JH48_9BACL